MSNSCRHVQLQGVIAANMSEGVDPTVVLLPQFGVVGSGSTLLSQRRKLQWPPIGPPGLLKFVFACEHLCAEATSRMLVRRNCHVGGDAVSAATWRRVMFKPDFVSGAFKLIKVQMLSCTEMRRQSTPNPRRKSFPHHRPPARPAVPRNPQLQVLRAL